ncbi:YesL family protein [Microbacterium sp. SS28]|uniref:YesL family protein n=1 Tax=Microbacterium sp. SS28 TaxID=2919948 RepID=UPI001FA97A02|nr:DUF624 domain-containing protein [Microbacterium sp. SS28]
MNSIFAPDSALMRILTRIADLMILNVLFLATALPIVTIPAAVTGLNFTAMRLVRGQSDSTTGDYFRSFRRNFRQATLLGLVIAALAAALGAWYVVAINLVPDGILRFIVLAVWFLVTFVLALNALWIFPYLATFEGSLRDVLRNARLLSGKHLLTSLMALAVIALAVIVSIFYPQVTGYGILWLVIGFAGVAFLTGVLFTRVFDAYAPQPTSDEE